MNIEFYRKQSKMQKMVVRLTLRLLTVNYFPKFRLLAKIYFFLKKISIFGQSLVNFNLRVKLVFDQNKIMNNINCHVRPPILRHKCLYVTLLLPF